MKKSITAMALDQFNPEMDTELDREEIIQTGSFDEWAEKVMSGMRRMESDPEFRARIEAMEAAASPKTTILDAKVRDHPR